MKKRITILAFALSITILSALTGCDNTENPESTSDSSSSDDISDSSDSVSDDGESESSLADDRESMLSELKLTTFEGPDGIEIYAEDADEIYRKYEGGKPVLKYNFAYIRYASPSFYAGDFLDDEAEAEWLAAVPEAEWFKVRVGDTLDCGLTVTKAEYERYAMRGNSVEIGGPILNNTVEFDGEITLEGSLYMSKNSGNYLTSPGDLVFAPDPTKTSGIPATTRDYDDAHCNIYRGVGISPNSNVLYVIADTGAYGWVLNAPDDVDKDEIFGDQDFVMVKVTLTNVKAGGYVNPDIPTIYADIVDIERID